jgi:hypothetical protein
MTVVMDRMKDGQPPELPQQGTLFGGKLYRGEVSGAYVGGTWVGRVTVNGADLQPRADLRNHSPSGWPNGGPPFTWGYSGPGSAQLALAICADYLGDDERALRIFESFKARCIVELKGQDDEPLQGWALAGDQIGLLLAEIARAEGLDPESFERLDAQATASVPGAPSRPMEEGELATYLERLTVALDGTPQQQETLAAEFSGDGDE